MTTESISCQQHYIDGQYQGTYANAKRFFARARTGKPKRLPNIIGKKKQKEQTEIKKIAMYILYDQRKGIFTTIFFTWFRYGTGKGICPK
jgi:hypothetical protein